MERSPSPAGEGGRRAASQRAARTVLAVTAAFHTAALVAASPLPASAQVRTAGEVRPTVYLPAGHPAYGVLERMRGAGLLGDFDLDRRPLSRVAVADALAEGVQRSRERGLEILGEAAVWVLREFGPEDSGGMAGLRPRGRPFSLHWEDAEGATLEAELTGELAWSGRTDIPPDSRAAGIGRGGAEIFGRVGPAMGYAARYRQSTEVREGTARSLLHDPQQGVAQVRAFGDDWASYTESSGHVSVDWKYFGLDLRFDSPAWGPSPERNLILSGNAPSFGHVQGRLALGGWLRYDVIFGALKSGIVDSVRSYDPDGSPFPRLLERQKYLVAHRLDLYPLKGFRFGLTEAVIAADRFPEFLYVVPTISVWDAQHYLNDPDNTMIGADVTWSLPGGPRLYGAIALDEWQIADTFADSTSHNWIAMQVGASWTPPVASGRLGLRLEATRVLPNVYRHKFPVNDWTHARHGLGYWSAQNSEVLEGEVSWLTSDRSSAALWGRYARKGGLVSIQEQYLIPPSEPFLFGPVRLGAWVGARFTLEGEHHWQAVGEVLRAPAELWPHTEPGSAGQQWQIHFRLLYNPF